MCKYSSQPFSYKLAVVTFISTFFKACIVFTAKERFAGGDATIGSSFAFAISKIHLIFYWAMVDATVGVIIAMIRNMGKDGIGRAISGMFARGLEIAWSIASLFVVPAMVYHGTPPIEALKKSAQTLKKTWGESIVRHFGLGLIQFLFILGAVGASIGIGFVLYTLFELTGLLIAILIFVILVLVIIVLFSCMNTVFNTALYQYADSGKIPTVFNKNANMIKNAYRVKSA